MWLDAMAQLISDGPTWKWKKSQKGSELTSRWLDRRRRRRRLRLQRLAISGHRRRLRQKRRDHLKVDLTFWRHVSSTKTGSKMFMSDIFRSFDEPAAAASSWINWLSQDNIWIEDCLRTTGTFGMGTNIDASKSEQNQIYPSTTGKRMMGWWLY